MNNKTWYLKNKEKILEKAKIRYIAKREELINKAKEYYIKYKAEGKIKKVDPIKNRENARRYKEKNRDLINRKNRERRKNLSPEAIKNEKQYHKEYLKNNRKKCNSYKTAYKAAKLQACPHWLSKEQKLQIKLIYEKCPDGFHVDHIVPLQGENVSGLHVPWNLQYLKAHENIIKRNKLIQ